MKATAAVARQPGRPLEIEEVELDDPREDEVLVEMVASGVCHTDLSARDGRAAVTFPIILGHEGAGTVLEVGSRVRGVEPGDRVLLGWDYCGRCARCRAGQTTYCDETSLRTFAGTRPDGSTRARSGSGPVRAAFFGQSSFATHALATERQVLVVAPDAPLGILAAAGCGMMTGAGAIWNALPVGVGSTVAVLGVGPVGLAAVLAASIAGAAAVVAVDRVASRLAVAAELGATATIDTTATATAATATATSADAATADAAELAEAIRSASGGGCDAILDTSGAAALVRAGAEALAVRGTLGLVAGGDPEPVVPTRLLTRGGRAVRGIVGGDTSSTAGIERLVDLHAAGRFPIERLVRHYPFERVNDALEDSLAGRAIKPVLTF